MSYTYQITNWETAVFIFLYSAVHPRYLPSIDAYESIFFSTDNNL